MPRRRRPILSLRETARRVYPDITEGAALRRIYRAVKAGVIPGVMRVNARSYAVSREALEAWLAGRNGGQTP